MHSFFLFDIPYAKFHYIASPSNARSSTMLHTQTQRKKIMKNFPNNFVHFFWGESWKNFHCAVQTSRLLRTLRLIWTLAPSCSGKIFWWQLHNSFVVHKLSGIRLVCVYVCVCVCVCKSVWEKYYLLQKFSGFVRRLIAIRQCIFISLHFFLIVAAQVYDSIFLYWRPDMWQKI